MREIDNEKYKKELDKARVKFGMNFYGRSGRLRCVIRWDDKDIAPGALTDEQLMIVAQLTGKAREPIVDELRRRDLIPARQEQAQQKGETEESQEQ